MSEFITELNKQEAELQPAESIVPSQVAADITEEPEQKQTPSPDELYKNQLAATREAREQNKKLRAELEASNQRFSQFESLREELAALRTKPAREQTQPDFDSDPDPLGRLNRELQELREEREERTKKELEAQKYGDYERQLINKTYEATQEFRSEQQDYDKAFEHVIALRKQELQAMRIPEYQWNHIINQDAMQLSQYALQQGMNPAALLYDLAKARGYAASQRQDVVEKAKNLQKGQEASSTLSGGGGKTTSKITLKDVANMSDEEFEKFYRESARSA